MLARYDVPLRYSSRTVLVVDDSELVRSSLSAFIDGHPGMVVSATAASARSAIEMADALHPDIALLDMNMPGGGARAATGIHSVWPHTRMLALTVRRDEQSVISMLQAGVSGYLLKGTRPQKILTGMEHVLKGRAVLSPELGRHVAQRLAVINDRAPANRDFERDPVRVLAVDDDPGVLEAVDALINGEPGMRLVGTATNVEDAIELASTARPDVALIDVRMPDWGGERVAFEIARVAPATRMIAFSASDDAEEVAAMLRGGACGYIVKGWGSQDLTDNIQSCARGHVVLDIGADVLRNLVMTPHFETRGAYADAA
ncbi:MAG TPA: response regulator [Candidatus Dormibacteraeota bacterium]|nr:response regulator [Candidatus Dormibacteraeota bacterium]